MTSGQWRCAVVVLLGGLALAGSAHAQHYIRTLDGNDGHVLTSPQFLAVDAANNSNVVYANYVGSSIDVYTSTGVFVRSITGNANLPSGVAVDLANDSNIVAVVGLGTSISVWKSDGTLVTSFTPGGANALSLGYGVAIDTANGSNILVADLDNDCVQVFTASGGYVRTIAGSGSNALRHPHDVAIDLANGSNVVVADTDNARIQVFSAAGAYIRTIAGSGEYALFAPGSVRVDTVHDSNIVVVDNSNRILIFTATGAPVRIIDPPTGRGGNDTALNAPNGVEVDAPNNGNILVADTRNNRIQVYDDLPSVPPPVAFPVPALGIGTLWALALLLLATARRRRVPHRLNE